MKAFLLIFCVISSLILAGCASNKDKDPYAGWSSNKIFAAGHHYVKEGDYTDAIAAFVSLNAQYPFEANAKQGDIELIYAYYKAGDPALALAASSRYLKLYPDDPNAAYAYYMAGVIEFNNGRGFLQRYFPYNMSEHHSSNYVSAFNSFNTVLVHFPESPYASDARRRMIYLKNMLGNYQLNIAQYYFDQKAYVAVLNRSKIILTRFPRTTAVKPALQLMIRAYGQLGLNELQANAEKVYTTNYGDDAFIKQLNPSS